MVSTSPTINNRLLLLVLIVQIDFELKSGQEFSTNKNKGYTDNFIHGIGCIIQLAVHQSSLIVSMFVS